MGTYNIDNDEFRKKFEVFLRSFEGDVSARVVSDSWNKLAKKYGWKDKLKTG